MIYNLFFKFIFCDRKVSFIDHYLNCYISNIFQISTHDQNPEIIILKDKQKEKGFTILEVLVTILVITGFLLGSLQATVLATLLRIGAQEKQEIANWVQQDLELIKYHAFTLPFNSETCGAYGQNLNDSITDQFPSSETISLPDHNPKSYDIVRNYNVSGNILQINYIVTYGSDHPNYTDSSKNNPVTTLLTEIIPNAALSCSY